MPIRRTFWVSTKLHRPRCSKKPLFDHRPFGYLVATSLASAASASRQGSKPARRKCLQFRGVDAQPTDSHSCGDLRLSQLFAFLQSHREISRFRAFPGYSADRPHQCFPFGPSRPLRISSNHRQTSDLKIGRRFPAHAQFLAVFHYLSLRIAVLRNFFVCTSGFRASRSLAQALLPFEGFLITRTCVEPRLIFTRAFDRRMGNASFARSVRIHAKLPIEKVAGVFHLEYSHTPPRLPH